jgi:hypothetical protein
MASVYCDQGTGGTPLYTVSAANTPTGATVYVISRAVRDYGPGSCEIEVCEFPAVEIHDAPDAFWHLPPSAPSRRPIRPAVHHSPRRHIAPIHFRHVRCQQRRREPRTRS